MTQQRTVTEDLRSGPARAGPTSSATSSVPSRTRRIPRHLDRVDVAVLDADQRQSLVCIRSLGRAGLRVGAFESCRAAAFGSRWCTLSGLLPNGARDADGYVAQVMEIVARHAPKVLIVASDETVETLRARRAEV